MAVFPDRIVLKNSTDTRADIESQVGAGGIDEIVQGELVIGVEQASASLYTRSESGTIVQVGGAGGGAAVPNFIDGVLNEDGTVGTFVTISTPSHKEGDLLTAIILWRTSSLPITAPAGWTFYDIINTTSSNIPAEKMQLHVYTKTATSSEPANYTWTGTSSQIKAGCIIATAYGLIDSYTQTTKVANNSDPIDVQVSDRYLSIVVHNWYYGSITSEVPVMSGAGIQPLAFAGTNRRQMQVGWTTESGTVSCSRTTGDQISEEAGVAILQFKIATGTGGSGQAYDVAMDGGDFDTGLTDDTTTIFDQFPISIDAHSDVDTTTTPPTSGQALVWNGVDNWVPGTVATGSVALDDLTDVTITAAATGEVLRYNGSAWVDAQLAYSDLSGTPTLATVATSGSYNDLANKPAIPASIDDLSDVDTATTAPVIDQVLVWDGSNWVPGDQTGGGGGGGGSVVGTIVRKTESQTAASSAATFSGIGASGLLVSFTSDIDAWIVLYPTAADRTADSGRAYGTDPTPGSGVLAEVFVAAGTTVLASPGTAYFNNDTVSSDAVYAAVRDQAGAAANATVTIVAYAHQTFAGTGTNRVTDSGTASSGALDLNGLGQTGHLCTVASSLDAWIVLYGSDADRTADAGRAFNTDPATGSGVMAEFYITAGTTILATPGTGYFNNDINPTDAVYLAVRDQAGAAVDSLVTITAYAETSYTGISGGTFGSG